MNLPKEAQARLEAALKGALKTPHKPLKDKKREPGKQAPLSFNSKSREIARQPGGMRLRRLSMNTG